MRQRPRGARCGRWRRPPGRSAAWGVPLACGPPRVCDSVLMIPSHAHRPTLLQLSTRPRRLEIDGLQRLRRVSLAAGGAPRRDRVDAGQIVRRQRHVERAQVLLQVGVPLGARDWRDVLDRCLGVDAMLIIRVARVAVAQARRAIVRQGQDLFRSGARFGDKLPHGRVQTLTVAPAGPMLTIRYPWGWGNGRARRLRHRCPLGRHNRHQRKIREVLLERPCYHMGVAGVDRASVARTRDGGASSALL